MYKALVTLALLVRVLFCCGQYKVTGSVIVKGEHLPGINVVEKGTQNGTTTDPDGNFELTVSDPNAILVASFVGMLTREAPLEGKQHIIIETKWDCIVDFFDAQHVQVYFSSGVVNTPVGGRVEASSPALMHGVVKGAYGYQTNLGNNVLQNAETGLYHYIANCSFNMNFVWHYRRVSTADQFNNRANSIETEFNTGAWQFIAGYSHLNFNRNDADEKLSGVTIGLGTVIPVKSYPDITAKISLYNGKVEYQVLIAGNFKRLVGFVRFYKLNSFYELSIGAGVHFGYWLHKKKG